jgi:hypothetical protein
MFISHIRFISLYKQGYENKIKKVMTTFETEFGRSVTVTSRFSLKTKDSLYS